MWLSNGIARCAVSTGALYAYASVAVNLPTAPDETRADLCSPLAQPLELPLPPPPTSGKLAVVLPYLWKVACAGAAHLTWRQRLHLCRTGNRHAEFHVAKDLINSVPPSALCIFCSRSGHAAQSHANSRPLPEQFCTFARLGRRPIGWSNYSAWRPPRHHAAASPGRRLLLPAPGQMSGTRAASHVQVRC